MVPSLLSTVILAMTVLPATQACNFHMQRRSNTYSNPHARRDTRFQRRAEEIDFEYVNSFDWHTIKPEYLTCFTGTSQSPIGVHSTQGLATTHPPSFAGYQTTTNTTGTFKNWGFGPAFDIDMVNEDPTTLPAMTFDDQTVFLSGWHIHFPSEHLVDGVRSAAEMHFVHVNAAGEPASVVGIRIEPSVTAHSAFFAQVPAAIPAPANPPVEGTPGVPMDHLLAIHEVGMVQQYWTYKGSLTTPPCSEGLRWFLPQMTLKVSEAQMLALRGAGRFSHRIEQVVMNQAINV
ncbi:Alpha carbonic anhydrase 3 [Cyphellophora attinorum]|uniref:Alpha carbonic anhydrase 3 n=1 Tax=Cyphellophora attinorum TaxID=1664694 RepID=A0A0N1NXI6_9EURO|nr:Alpha carbonic anhydrase 3 [Phialophora attinorum]KPI37723.1 Alpha carbonic anhydrase 3 [Phialophora attinorum]